MGQPLPLGPRSKGQDVHVLIVQNRTVLETITAVRSFEITPKMKKLVEGYLGESTNRYDDVYDGVEGKFDVDEESKDIHVLRRAIIDRARRRVAGVIFNIKVTIDMPNGDRPRILIPNVSWGELPATVSERTAYVRGSFDYGASDYVLI